MRRALPLLVSLSVVAALVWAGSAAATAAGPSRNPPVVVLLTVDGTINPAVTDYIVDSLAAAERTGAAAVVIRLDTPGGLLSSTRRIVEALLNAPVPVIVYVAPAGASAASAGTFITEAANIAAMAPGTTIGAAHPVSAGGVEPKGVVESKVENFTASFAQSIARARGRNVSWIEQAVRKSAVLGEREALAQNVIDLIAPDLPTLLLRVSGRTVTVAGGSVTLRLADAIVRARAMTPGQRVLNLLADPDLVYLLLLAGIAGIYFEFAHPGVFLPGVVGAICLLLALAAFEVLPINLAGFLLIVLGLGMLGAEVFVTSYGVLGVGGVCAFVIGSLFFIDSSATGLVVSRRIIAGATVAMSAAIVGIGFLLIRGRRRPVTTGAGALVGEIAVVREPIGPDAPGKVFVHGEVWRAVSAERLATGERARVTRVSGLEMEVRRAS